MLTYDGTIEAVLDDLTEQPCRRTLGRLRAMQGAELGVSEWLTVTQELRGCARGDDRRP
jgi:hypothetical protein